MDVALGTRMQKRLLKIGSALYDAGNTSRIKINPGYLFRRFYGRIVGSMNITVAGTAMAEAPLGLVSKLALVVDGGRTVWASSGRDLFRLAHHETSKQPELVPPTGTGAAVPISAAIPFFFEAVRRAVSGDSLFDSAPYADINLEITWAQLASIYTGGTASVNASTSFTLIVEDTVKGHGQVALLKRVSYIEKPITASQPDFEIPLPKSGILDKILIRADRDATPADDLINAVSFRFDDSFDIVKTVPWVDLQSIGVYEYSLDQGSAGTGRIPGYAMIDPIENGMLTSSPNLRGMVDPKLVLDVTLGSGTTRLVRATIVTYELIEQPAAAAA